MVKVKYSCLILFLLLALSTKCNAGSFFSDIANGLHNLGSSFANTIAGKPNNKVHVNKEAVQYKPIYRKSDNNVTKHFKSTDNSEPKTSQSEEVTNNLKIHISDKNIFFMGETMAYELARDITNIYKKTSFIHIKDISHNENSTSKTHPVFFEDDFERKRQLIELKDNKVSLLILFIDSSELKNIDANQITDFINKIKKTTDQILWIDTNIEPNGNDSQFDICAQNGLDYISIPNDWRQENKQTNSIGKLLLSMRKTFSSYIIQRINEIIFNAKQEAYEAKMEAQIDNDESNNSNKIYKLTATFDNSPMLLGENINHLRELRLEPIVNNVEQFGRADYFKNLSNLTNEEP